MDCSGADRSFYVRLSFDTTSYSIFRLPDVYQYENELQRCIAFPGGYHM